MLALREALGIVQTVRVPAQVLERGVARLSAGMDATIALVTTATAAAPATLGLAADAVRFGLAEMRASAAELDATFTAAISAQDEDRPEAEFVAHILAVRRRSTGATRPSADLCIPVSSRCAMPPPSRASLPDRRCAIWSAISSSASRKPSRSWPRCSTP